MKQVTIFTSAYEVLDAGSNLVRVEGDTGPVLNKEATIKLGPDSDDPIKLFGTTDLFRVEGVTTGEFLTAVSSRLGIKLVVD